MKENLNRILVKHTGRSFEQIQADTDRDYYMSGEEAKAYGLIDYVIRNRDDLFQLAQKAA
jgi:ATP-dependent Clp protease protease subunit